MMPTADQVKRKEASLKILKKNNIPYIDHLPFIRSEDEVEIRPKEEICGRAVCLALIAAFAEGLEKHILVKKAEEFGVKDKFSEEERKFIVEKSTDKNEKAKFLWRYEALWVMLWSLSYVDELDLPTGICDVQFAVTTVAEQGPERFSANARLRNKKEILDQADLIYRIHWATNEARLKNREMPAGLNNDTVYERHYTLNWLTNYQGQNWDKISTDT